MHIRLGQGNGIQMYRRLHLDVVGRNCLGDVLLVLLAFLGYVDHQVPEDTGVTAEAPPILEPALRLLHQLGCGHFGEMFHARIDAMLGELALLRQHLAFAALTLTAADRFQVDAESLCRLQYRGPDRYLSTQARRHE